MSVMSRKSRNSPFQRNQHFFGVKNQQQLFCNRYFNYFMNIALQRFKWEGLPDEIVPSYLEKILFENQCCLFFKDEAIDMYAVMRTAMGGMIDIYNVPEQRFAYANRYYGKFDKSDSVLIWDNMTNYPCADYLYMYANSLATMRMTRDINIFAQRTPVVIASTADTNITTSNILNQYAEFIPFLQLDSKYIEDMDKAIRALDLKTPIVFDKINVAMQKEMSDCLTFLGIDSNAVDKGERMISGEVSGNNGLIEANRRASLDLRQRAAEQINRMFGLNVSVNFNSDIPLVNMPLSGVDGGETSGEPEETREEGLDD